MEWLSLIFSSESLLKCLIQFVKTSYFSDILTFRASVSLNKWARRDISILQSNMTYYFVHLTEEKLIIILVDSLEQKVYLKKVRKKKKVR